MGYCVPVLQRLGLILLGCQVGGIVLLSNSLRDNVSINFRKISFLLPPNSYRFMVMERLGVDLQQKLSDQKGTFQKSTVLQLGIRVVSSRWFTPNSSVLEYLLVLLFMILWESKDYCLGMSVIERRKDFGEIDNHGLCRWQAMLCLAIAITLSFPSQLGVAYQNKLVWLQE